MKRRCECGRRYRGPKELGCLRCREIDRQWLALEAKELGVTCAGKARGSRHPAAKLTEAGAAEIRERRAMGEKLKTIAEDYGLNLNTVWKVVTGKTWREHG